MSVMAYINYALHPEEFQPKVLLQKKYEGDAYITTHLLLGHDAVLILRPEQLMELASAALSGQHIEAEA